MSQPLYDGLAGLFPNRMRHTRYRKPIQRLAIIFALFTIIIGLLVAYPVLASKLVTHVAGQLVSQINVGGSAVGSFAADADFTGGLKSVSKAAVSGVSDPALQAVYQSYRYGNFTYTIPNLAPGASYTVRLDFAEMYWKQAGQRTFNVSANGQQLLSNFDIFATAGGPDKAITKEFTVIASGSGTIVLQFTSIKNNAQVNGIEVFDGSSIPTPTVVPISTSTQTSTSTGGVPVSNALSNGWNIVWSDNFAGSAGSVPSSTNWIEDTGTGYPGGPTRWGTSEVETMSNSTNNVSLDGKGHLNITALNSNRAWTSGRIETRRSDFAAPAGGVLEVTASIKQPNPANGLGYWPKFWAVGAQYRGNVSSWPSVGETDIMEDTNTRSETAATLHCGTAPNGPCNEYTGFTSGLATCPNCQTGYHTYTEIIDRTKSDEQIRWYVDNQQIWVVNESQVGVSTWQAAVDHGFFLVFDLAIGGAFPNAICGCTSPSSTTSSGGILSIGPLAVYQMTGTPPAPLTIPTVPTGSSVVHVTGTQDNWQLTVNGSPYEVKGVTFGPPNAAAGAYMAELKSMGVNTLRTWGTDATTQSLLDAASAYGLKVINGFWLDQGTDYLNDTTYKTNTLNDIKKWVTTYKNNPGVLMWDVGNEVILTLQNTYSGTKLQQERNAYAQYVDQIAQAIHAIDPNHPVTSTDAWTGAWSYYKANSPHLDLYAVNSYGSVCTVKQSWISGGYTKPYIITETGPAGEWEVPNDANGVPNEPTDTQKRDAYLAAWNCITSHPGVSLGATLFHYGIENDFGGVWLNLLTGHWKRLSYYAVKQAFGGQASTNEPPVISSMSLSQTSVKAGSQFVVNINVSDPNNDPMRYNLMLSSKYVDKSITLQYATFTQTGTESFTVTAPQKQGVWKVYIYVYDGQGNVGIETRSFKVV